jgi:hypothetical protein
VKDKSAAEMVNERWNLADRGREDYAAQAVENEKLYRAYIDESSHPYLSNICLPWPYIIVESYLGKCIQMLAGMLPYVRVVEEDDSSREKAKKVEKDANMCLYLQKWPILAYKLYKQAFKYPCGWLEISPWGVVDGREMPIFNVRNWFNTWVNPTIVDLEDPDAFVIAVDYVPAWLLKDYLGNPSYKNINKIDTHEGTIYTPEEQEVQSFKGIPTKTEDKYSELVKVTRYWSYKDFIIMTGDNNIIRNDGENFLGSLPFKAVRPVPLEDEFYGMSILDEGKGLFDEINENENQFNDAVNLMLNPQWIISRGAEVKRSTIVAKAGGILFTDDVNGIVPMKIDWNILTAALQRKSRIEQDIQNYSNAFPAMRGQPSSGDTTATEFMGMRSAGELRSDTYNLLLSMMSIEDMVRDIVKYKKMFMTQPNSFYYWPEEENVTVTADDYSGNFTYKAVSQYKMSKEIERKQFIEAMALVWGNQAFLPMIGPKADQWLSRLLDYFGIRDAEQLFSNPQEQKMMNMMMQAMGATQGGNGSTPALGEREMRMPELSPNPGGMGDMGGMMGQ